MADDLAMQVQNLGRGLVQVNLRLTRLLEVVEGGSSQRSASEPHTEVLLDLLEAIDRTLEATLPTQPARWWHVFLPRDERPGQRVHKLSDLEALSGLKLARADALARLRTAGIEPIPSTGPIDPRLHAIVETSACAEEQHGTIAVTHRRGWMRRGDPPVVVRHAHVTAYARST